MYHGYYYGFDTTYLLLVVPALLIALIAQIQVKSAFSRYARVRCTSGLTGAQAAEHVLRLLDDREATLVRAKRALIRQRGLTEAQAHRLLQRRAMETGASVLDAARAALRTLAKEEET